MSWDWFSDLITLFLSILAFFDLRHCAIFNFLNKHQAVLLGFVVDEEVILNHKLPILVLRHPVIIQSRTIHDLAGVGLVILVRTFEGFAVGGFLLGLHLVCDTTR